MVEYRIADLVDGPAIAELGFFFHEQNPVYSDFVYDPQRVCDHVAFYTTEPDYCVFIAEEGTKIIGALFAFCGPAYFSPDIVAMEQTFFVHPDYRTHGVAGMLLNFFEKWADRKGAKAIVVDITNTTTQLKSIERYFSRKGYKYAGGTLVKKCG